MPKKELFFAEMTDTFGGEANYCWARRVKVAAQTMRGAAIKMSRHFGLQKRLRRTADYGDGRRYDVRGAAVCVFLRWHDDANEHLFNVEEI